MTRAEYEKKFGKPPAAAKAAPVRMTQAEYDAKYGRTPAPSVAQKFDTGMKEATAARTAELNRISDANTKGEQGFARSAFQAGGQFVGAAVDPFVQGVKAAVPDWLKSALAVGAKAAAPIITKPAEALSKTKLFQEAAAASPELSIERDIKAFQEYLNLAPGPKGAATAGRILPKTLDAAMDTAKAASRAVAPTKLQSKAVSALESDIREAAYGNSQKVLVRSETRGKDPVRFLAERNIKPDVKGGKMVTAEKADALHASADPLNDHLDMGLAELEQSTPRRKLSDLEQRAIKNVRTERNIANNSAGDFEAGIRREFAEYRKSFGDEITLRQANAIKRGKWGKTPFDASKPLQSDINYAIGRAMKDDIEATVPKEAFGIHELNAHIGDIYDAEKFLRTLDGQTVKGGRLGKYSGRIIGAAVGSSGGPLGTFFGALGGDMVAELLQRSTFSNPVRALLLRNLQKADPAAYQQVLDFMKRAGMERDTRLALPGASSIPMGPRTPPASSVTSVPAAKGPTGVNTKTGKFIKTFMSTPKKEN
ncbi:hypothetical protein EDE08_101652 [Bradyrhizobium sp. R2.2-H]|uniref:hypothetical protein n=1 Tax=unclassified Bradyrhizobium TaxID=2631580 RepID=UPI0010449E54|nr:MULTISPECIES: hypothetical protein [unclassified Bradyrhizobium]TCU78870.1 hypothetical protein EDE10_101653 [Bradyrhizobium sp. Y-H1]TCU80953.1 hypothetical protein EDE08_101652 [Bradyrhizobium sp. R2.2-H]